MVIEAGTAGAAEDRRADSTVQVVAQGASVTVLLRRRRRREPRYNVDDPAAIVPVRVGSRIPGRILDLSLSGCRVRTFARFPLGIYTRVETEFHHQGVPFRLGGVIQAIHDCKTVGIRFLDLSERKRQQVRELIQEIAESRAAQAPA